MQVTLFGADDPAWDSRLRDTRHDIYHSAGYHRFERRRGGGEPYLAVVETARSHLAWPYLLRPITVPGGPTGRHDVTSVYGYAGPLAWGPCLDEGFLGIAWAELLDLWRAQGVVSVFTRLHPLLDNRELAGAFAVPGDDAGGVHEVGQTVSIDCRACDETVVSAYARPLRKHLENAVVLGYVTEEDIDWTQLAEFVRVHDESMDRNAARDSYRLTADDLVFLHDALAGRAHLLFTRTRDEVVAGGLFTQSSGIVQAHLMGTATAHLTTSPGKALLDGARRWARVAGYDVLHLGGGRGGRSDSLFRFKREFSRRRHAFAVGRWVLDAVAYSELWRLHDPRSDRDPGSGGYFPAYRAPSTAPSAAS